MEIFGNKTDVRIVVFSEDHTPTPGKLKKLFSSPYALIYKRYGSYGCHMNAIEAVLRTDAELQGVAFEGRWCGANLVVLDATASYNAFTITAQFQHILGCYQLNAVGYERITKLISAIERVQWQLRVCDDFIRTVQAIREAVRSFGEADPVAESLDSEAFRVQYGQCGQAGLVALKRLLAAELPNVLWQASVPVYQGDTNTNNLLGEQSDAQKAA